MKNALKNVSFVFLLLKMCFFFGQDISTHKRIVLDPGHGANDSGAIGKDGIKEKEVVLDVALEILKLNEAAESPLDIYLTRYNDTLISLSDRTKLAKALNADLFVSLHCNHSDNPNARGIEVYVGKNESGNSKESVWLAFQLQDQIKKQLGFESRGLKFADFQVLRETADFCPSLLLEQAFLSNQDESRFISKDANIKRIASTILLSIENY